jgi:glycosyltransferase involved in cell wall biosynthesis
VRVCLIVNIAYEAGGAEKSVRLIRDRLRERGHAVQVIATSRDLGGRPTFADVIVPAVGDAMLARLVGRLWYHRAYRRVRAAIRAFRPDVVHLHTIGEFSPAVLAAVRHLPTVLTVHGPEAFITDLLPWLLTPADYRTGSYDPKDLTVGGRVRYLYLRHLQRAAYRPWLRTVDRVLCPSLFIAGTVRDAFPPGAVHHLLNGIELPAARAFPAEPTVLYVGRLAHVKGVHVLFEALSAVLAAVPDARVEIVGDGPERQTLTAAAHRLGIAARVVFRGWLAGADLLAAYTAAAVVVIPSVWPENFPTVALEARGVGRPVVGSAVGGLPELVADGATGRVVPPGDRDALAAALIAVLSDLPAARRMGELARSRAGEFDVGTFVESLEEHYRSVVPA